MVQECSGKVILKNAMSVNGMTQRELADALKKSTSTVSTGMRRDRMSLEVFVGYLDALGFDVLVVGRDGKTQWRVK